MNNDEASTMPMVSETTIRMALPDDADVIYAFICLLKEQTFDFGLFNDLYKQALSCSNNFYLVTVDDEKIVGFISCYEQILLHRMGKVFEIQELFVEEQYRSKGIGRMLVKSVEDAICAQPYVSLEVSANIRRTKTHQFYLDCGFNQSHFKFTKLKTL